MKTTSKLNYGLYFIAINLVLLGALSCKKHQGAVPGAVAPTKHQGTPTNPGAVTPTKELVMTPYFTDNQIIRYKQKSQNSCLITSIYMLVHSMKGNGTAVDESETEYQFDGAHNKNNPDEKKLATDNNLIYHHILLENTLGITPTTDASSYTYSDFRNTVNTLADILKIGPFVLGMQRYPNPGHAVLVIGIEKKDGTLIYIDPENHNVNMCCSIFNPFLAGISELYYPNSYVKQPTQHYTPTKEEEQFFEKSKSDGAKTGPKEYNP